MFGLSEEDLGLIVAVFGRHPEVERVEVFGSRAMGVQQPHSDIDLVVWGELGQGRLGELYEELDELPMPYLFDLKWYDEITHEPLKEHIREHGCRLYARGG